MSRELLESQLELAFSIKLGTRFRKVDHDREAFGQWFDATGKVAQRKGRNLRRDSQFAELLGGPRNFGQMLYRTGAELPAKPRRVAQILDVGSDPVHDAGLLEDFRPKMHPAIGNRAAD